jgi:ABC-type amino acid transport substrate-binding protein
MTVEEFGRLQVYFITFNLAALFLTFWVLPMMLTAVTPFKYRDVVGMSKDAMATAFTTGNLFVVLTVLTENCKSIFKKYDLAEERTDSYVDVIIPVSFNFPTTGKLLMLLFILFAAWFSGSTLSMKQYPTFVFSGLLSFFGGIDIAIPFMLNIMRLPADLFQLYVVTGILNSRFATLLAAMNLLVFTILATCAISGSLSINKKRLMKYIATTLALTVAMVGASRLYFSHFVKNEYTADEAFVQMHLLTRPVEAEVYTKLPARAPYHAPNTSSLDRILARGTLRVGYTKDRLPYVFVNKKGQLVGFDIEMAHELARELGVSLEFFLLEHGKFEEQLNAGYCDIFMAGMRITPQKALKVTFSQPYLDERIAFVVKDHLRETFSDRQTLLKQESLRIGLIKDPYLLTLVESYLPEAELVQLKTPRDFFRKKEGDLDALLFTAEAGSAWTLLYPDYTVVVPRPKVVSIPTAYALPRGEKKFLDYVNSWLALKKTDGTIEELFNHWILGEGAKETKPRWSVIRNVLHWVD